MADLAAYATGSTRLQSYANASDDWLHPVGADYFLEDPERYLGPFDNEGLPLQRFGDLPPVEVPSRTAAFAFVHWSRWRRLGDRASRDSFIKAAQWFRAFPDGRILHNYELAGASVPWISGLAQGEALSIFARAELIEPGAWVGNFTPISDWLARPVNEGGTLDHLPDGSPFFEEYPGSRHRHVLNGCLYAVVGLMDCNRIEFDSYRSELANAVLDGIERNLRAWERKGWSLYEFPDPSGGAVANFNTPGYQLVHIALLQYIALHAQRPVLAEAASRLSAALCNPLRRLVALRGKLAYRLATGW